MELLRNENAEGLGGCSKEGFDLPPQIKQARGPGGPAQPGFMNRRGPGLYLQTVS